MVKVRNLFVFFVLLMGNALGDKPRNWQMGFQDSVTPVMDKIHSFHNQLMIIVFAILAFVLILLAYTLWRFRASKNPTPSKTTHNTAIEMVWTAIPVMIIASLVFPSVRLLRFMDKAEEAEMTVKIIAHQWYWSYEYPDHGKFAFDSYMIEEKDLKPGQLRLLEVDNRVVIPVDTNIRFLVSSTDVIHSWAVPSFGIKKDAVPGRVNETWVRVRKEGVYYGQCSELCGPKHGFMPIAVEVVSKDKFNEWAAQSKTKFS